MQLYDLTQDMPPLHRVVISYQGGEGSEIASFTRVPQRGEVLMLQPPSHRAQYQADAYQCAFFSQNPEDYLPHVVTHVTDLKDGTPRISVKIQSREHRSLYPA